MKLHHWIVLLIALVVVGGLVLWPKFQSKDVYTDELTGTWRAEGTSENDYQWWMEYTFEDHDYTLATDSYYKEKGTYLITERFLDGSMTVKKTFSDGSKEYEIVVVTTDDPDVIQLDGAILNRVKK
ncbi:hypothetical protein HZA87_00080 [Candidatus Uhrbacteria bacterium]|nr:hypothetical protein [Candidatus Uhrbacteria bacterium]